MKHVLFTFFIILSAASNAQEVVERPEHPTQWYAEKLYGITTEAFRDDGLKGYEEVESERFARFNHLLSQAQLATRLAVDDQEDAEEAVQALYRAFTFAHLYYKILKLHVHVTRLQNELIFLTEGTPYESNHVNAAAFSLMARNKPKQEQKVLEAYYNRGPLPEFGSASDQKNRLTGVLFLASSYQKSNHPKKQYQALRKYFHAITKRPGLYVHLVNFELFMEYEQLAQEYGNPNDHRIMGDYLELRDFFEKNGPEAFQETYRKGWEEANERRREAEERQTRKRMLQNYIKYFTVHREQIR